MVIRTKRIYDPPSRTDGTRVLVDRLWPRGVSKADAALDAWHKDLAPSDALRRWFGHDAERWPEFVQRYTCELDAKRDLVVAMLDSSSKKTITLLYAAKDAEQNNAVVLKRFITADILPKRETKRTVPDRSRSIPKSVTR